MAAEAALMEQPAPLPYGCVQMTNEEYHNAPGTSKSQLDVIADSSPLHFWYRYENPDREPWRETPALRIGSAIHYALLEPHLFETVYVCIPEDAPTRPTSRQINAKKPSPETVAAINYWDNFNLSNVGRKQLTLEDFEVCQRIRDAAHRHPVAAGLLTGGKAEQSYFATDPTTGELIKCRTDYIIGEPNGGLVVDVKSALDASPIEFGKSAASYRYDVQAAWYYHVFRCLYGAEPRQWAFLAFEKTPPYAIGIYYITELDIERASMTAQRDFTRIIQHRRTNFWPDYGHEIRPLSLPTWIKR